jgi:hypothetical protein
MRLVKCRGRVLRVSTISMPRSRAARMGVHDGDAARQDRPQKRGGGTRSQHVGGTAVGKRTVVTQRQRFNPGITANVRDEDRQRVGQPDPRCRRRNSSRWIDGKFTAFRTTPSRR